MNEYVNIRGNKFFNDTAIPISLGTTGYNRRVRGCEFDERPGGVNYQKNFGEYGVVRGAEYGFFILLRYNLTDRKTL